MACTELPSVHDVINLTFSPRSPRMPFASLGSISIGPLDSDIFGDIRSYPPLHLGLDQTVDTNAFMAPAIIDDDVATEAAQVAINTGLGDCVGELGAREANLRCGKSYHEGTDFAQHKPPRAPKGPAPWPPCLKLASNYPTPRLSMQLKATALRLRKCRRQLRSKKRSSQGSARGMDLARHDETNKTLALSPDAECLPSEINEVPDYLLGELATEWRRGIRKPGPSETALPAGAPYIPDPGPPYICIPWPPAAVCILAQVNWTPELHVHVSACFQTRHRAAPPFFELFRSLASAIPNPWFSRSLMRLMIYSSAGLSLLALMCHLE